jgi:hypothetical protein
MLGILKFQTFLLVVLLFICSCTYLHGVFPAWLDRNKSGYVTILLLSGLGRLYDYDCVPDESLQTSGNILASSADWGAFEPIC